MNSDFGSKNKRSVFIFRNYAFLVFFHNIEELFYNFKNEFFGGNTGVVITVVYGANSRF